MPCYPFRDEKGNMSFLCTSEEIMDEPERCYICGKPATVLCDAPKGDNLFGEACDKPMCRQHAHHIGLDNDVCDYHFNEISVRKAKLDNWVKSGKSAMK